MRSGVVAAAVIQPGTELYQRRAEVGLSVPAPRLGWQVVAAE